MSNVDQTCDPHQTDTRMDHKYDEGSCTPSPFVGEGGRRPGEGSRTNGERLLWCMRSLANTRPSLFSLEAEAECCEGSVTRAG